MQSGRSTAESVKESAANAAASAKAAIEKAKATTEEKGERMRTSDPVEKEAATRRKEERKTQAQLNKEEAHSHNKDARWIAESGGPHPGYKTWGANEDYTLTGVAGAATAAATTETEAPALTGSTGDYTTIPTGPATADQVHPRGPVRADAPRFT